MFIPVKKPINPELIEDKKVVFYLSFIGMMGDEDEFLNALELYGEGLPYGMIENGDLENVIKDNIDDIVGYMSGEWSSWEEYMENRPVDIYRLKDFGAIDTYEDIMAEDLEDTVATKIVERIEENGDEESFLNALDYWYDGFKPTQCDLEYDLKYHMDEIVQSFDNPDGQKKYIKYQNWNDYVEKHGDMITEDDDDCYYLR